MHTIATTTSLCGELDGKANAIKNTTTTTTICNGIVPYYYTTICLGEDNYFEVITPSDIKFFFGQHAPRLRKKIRRGENFYRWRREILWATHPWWSEKTQEVTGKNIVDLFETKVKSWQRVLERKKGGNVYDYFWKCGTCNCLFAKKKGEKKRVLCGHKCVRERKGRCVFNNILTAIYIVRTLPRKQLHGLIGIQFEEAAERGNWRKRRYFFH